MLCNFLRDFFPFILCFLFSCSFVFTLLSFLLSAAALQRNDSLTEFSYYVSILDLSDAEAFQHALVLVDLVLFELIYGYKSMLDGYEVNKGFVVVDHVTGCLNIGFQSDPRRIFATFRLEKVSHRCLVVLQLLELTLVVASFVFARLLLLHYIFTAIEGVKHSLHV